MQINSNLESVERSSNFAFVEQSRDEPLEQNTQPQSIVNLEDMQEDVDRMMQQFPSEKTMIDEFEKALEAMTVPTDLRNVMSQHLGNFLAKLGAVSKMVRHGKYEPAVVQAIKALLKKVVEPQADEVLRILKEIMLVRQRDRAIRENSIRAIKQLLKLCPNLN